MSQTLSQAEQKSAYLSHLETLENPYTDSFGIDSRSPKADPLASSYCFRASKESIKRRIRSDLIQGKGTRLGTIPLTVDEASKKLQTSDKFVTFEQVIASSLERKGNDHKSDQGSSQDTSLYRSPNSNSLYDAIHIAYSRHLKLILRPDDIWLAIVIQFGFYVNGHAEQLRHKLVPHQDKIMLQDSTIDYGMPGFVDAFAERMTLLIREHVKDPALVDWLMPEFTTTTAHDKTVATMALMSTLKAYFNFGMSNLCGLPEVELQGTLQDWQTLRQKLNRLLDFSIQEESDGLNDHDVGPEGHPLTAMQRWHCMLSGILDEMVLSRSGLVNHEFWNSCMYEHAYGSGDDVYSGWANAFVLFSSQGNVGQEQHQRSLEGSGDSYNMGTRRDLQGKPLGTAIPLWASSSNTKVAYPCFSSANIASGLMSVPISIHLSHMPKPRMAAICGGQGFLHITEMETCVQPRSDWLLGFATVLTAEEHKQAKEEQKRKQLDGLVALVRQFQSEAQNKSTTQDSETKSGSPSPAQDKEAYIEKALAEQKAFFERVKSLAAERPSWLPKSMDDANWALQYDRLEHIAANPKVVAMTDDVLRNRLSDLGFVISEDDF